MENIELWAGAECTVNRVGDQYRDQLRLTGLHDRPDQLGLIAELGARAMRFPILWERVAPDPAMDCDWQWSDAGMTRLRSLAIRPIVGLVHHGSGPRHTSLLDDRFPQGLAAYACQVAERYPWVEDWTPVNEPLTTARFSALYGHWYPHARDEGAFWRALVNQIDGVRLAMAEIRKVHPGARLIQTDDLGRTYATAPLGEQAAFDNIRRWLGWDLLFGRVTRDHPFWERLYRAGLEDRLRRIADAPCPPDIVGLNHYLTSDRFLDHRLQRYPRATHGGNDAMPFADVEAVRVLDPPAAGLRGAIAEAWARYRTPIAITEAHNGCTREEQARWFADAWTAAHEAQAAGVDLRAVTAWAVFGSRGWNRLLTGDGVYEPGVFDLRGPTPRHTLLARTLKALAAGDNMATPARPEGWWTRDIRLIHPAAPRPAPMREHQRTAPGQDQTARPILITGATGTLGQALAAACRHRNLAHVLTGRHQLDLTDARAMAATLDAADSFAVINAAGWVRVDEAEAQQERCMAVNAQGAAALARLCAERGLPTVNFSSDLVFGDTPGGPFTEADPPAPLNAYGRSKAAMEAAIQNLPGDHLVLRTAAFFSPHDEWNFAIAVIRALRGGRSFAATPHCTVSPTYVPALCDAVLDLLLDGETGLRHATHGEALSWYAFAVRIAEVCGLDATLVLEATPEALGWVAKRPRNAALGNASSPPPATAPRCPRTVRQRGARRPLYPPAATNHHLLCA